MILIARWEFIATLSDTLNQESYTCTGVFWATEPATDQS